MQSNWCRLLWGTCPHRRCGSINTYMPRASCLDTDGRPGVGCKLDVSMKIAVNQPVLAPPDHATGRANSQSQECGHKTRVYPEIQRRTCKHLWLSYDSICKSRLLINNLCQPDGPRYFSQRWFNLLKLYMDISRKCHSFRIF